ncbi:hypothetical protein GXB85_14025 [Cellulomonas sp. APG4]|uniref:hypothetical protein n=1 Tax=Cellulomonas sp. APG4 TaxID=1538656 RepID=UPI0013795EDE|nr:hypothetical protein [Cellulomonas sp. APG4]NCT92061.1 hypothetical protein [Cellulomonas sp. APG4]
MSDDPGSGHDVRRDRRARTDRHLLRVYLDDHLAGSSAGARRMRHAAGRLARTPVGPDLEAVAHEVASEQRELAAVVDALGLSRSRLKEFAARVGEIVARLKPDGGLRRSSPMTALIEAELLRSALVGKRGVWQTLLDLSEELDLDGARMAELVARTDRQLATLDRVHAYVRVRALRSH